jgi:hypothetical protein
MHPDERKRAQAKDLVLAATIVAAGLVVSGLSPIEVQARESLQQAQAAPTPQASPSVEPKPPAESKPGGTRPTTPAPEPARPAPEAQKLGVEPALPPAPAEKIAPPIKDK